MKNKEEEEPLNNNVQNLMLSDGTQCNMTTGIFFSFKLRGFCNENHRIFHQQ